jgi:hypothetical protein
LKLHMHTEQREASLLMLANKNGRLGPQLCQSAQQDCRGPVESLVPPDLQLDFVPTFVPGPNAESAPVPNPAADSGPSMLSAIRDQLGLKLEGGKATIEYLVIDHVEKPTPD